MHTFHYILFNYIIIIIIKKIHGFLVAFDIIGKIKFNKWQQFLYTYHEYNMQLCNYVLEINKIIEGIFANFFLHNLNFTISIF